MSDTETEHLIQQIKQTFPQTARREHIVNGYSPVTTERLKETLEGKDWDEAVLNPKIVYNLSDIDHMREITSEACLYYLPAFLIGTLIYPDSWIYYSSVLEKISTILPQFSSDQLDALIAFLISMLVTWRREA
jgi:hypothetical protein